MATISVLIIDDSLVMRNLISRIVNMTPGLSVAAACENGRVALNRILDSRPDVIVCDIEMPVMNGVEFLKAKNSAGIDVPVIILSSLAERGAKVTMNCLKLGAVDFIRKPASALGANLSSVSAHLVELLLAYGGRHAKLKNKSVAFNEKESAVLSSLLKVPVDGLTSQVSSDAKPVNDFCGERIDAIGIGISTGGPIALRQVLSEISPQIKQPILIVQHMPAGFTRDFAESLNELCPLPVHEAVNGEPLLGGNVYIAPGDFHLTVSRGAAGISILLTGNSPRNSHRPSVDELFASMAQVFGKHSLAVIMTGMGNDGAQEITNLCRLGALTLGQDRSSSVVYGMPKVANELGGVQIQLPLAQIAAAINEYALKHSN